MGTWHPDKVNTPQRQNIKWSLFSVYVCVSSCGLFSSFSEKNVVEYFQNISVFALIFCQHLLTMTPCNETIMYSYYGHKNGKILCSASDQ